MFPSPYGDFVFQLPDSAGYPEPALRFRPLTGILFFNVEQQSLNCTVTDQKFPSPYGDFVFQPARLIMKIKKEVAVSVPLRGFCFSTQEAVSLMKEKGKEVSVPLRGFCFSTFDKKKSIQTSTSEFPSPYGDFVFQQQANQAYTLDNFSFRPLTGILFFNMLVIPAVVVMITRSFRPLTGILFFNRFK